MTPVLSAMSFFTSFTRVVSETSIQNGPPYSQSTCSMLVTSRRSVFGGFLIAATFASMKLPSGIPFATASALSFKYSSRVGSYMGVHSELTPPSPRVAGAYLSSSSYHGYPPFGGIVAVAPDPPVPGALLYFENARSELRYVGIASVRVVLCRFSRPFFSRDPNRFLSDATARGDVARVDKAPHRDARARDARGGAEKLGPRSRMTRASICRAAPARAARAASTTDFPSFFPPEVRELEEPAAIAMARRCRSVSVDVPGRAKAVLTSCAGDAGPAGSDAAPFVLLHGFDSSCLEYRRLFPKLAAKAETWAVDLLGWGFTDAQDGGIGDYSPEAKRAHLYAFWKANVGRPMVLCGASLGGAAAIDFATNHPEAVEKLVLIDAQGFIEGLGPMGALPRPVAKMGVNILRTTALRNAANQMAYYDKATFATDDALRVGRLHTFAPQWCDATLSFMQSGGFKVRNSIAKVPMETLVLWGREDKILEPSYAEKFMKELPNARLVWVEKCGHVAHLEQPDFMCQTLWDFAGKTSAATA